jgi:integration host factor subunit beta
MQKSDITQKIIKKISHLPANTISTHIDKIIEIMNQTLIDKNRIEIRGFGSFTVHYRPPNKSYCPSVGYVMSQAKFRPFFKPGKELRQRVDKKK